MNHILQAASVTKAFAGVQALKGVDFTLERGEVHALAGENGAGKSTLIKIITGALTADAGTLVVDGQAVVDNTPSVARSLGIAAIYQQPSLFPHLTVMENIALALESGGVWRRVNWRARRAKAVELLERAGAGIDSDRLAGSLSMPEQQIVEIAKAIGGQARILIMDEPTASLTTREVERLFRLIADLREQGAGIVYISHRLEEIFAIADRVTVLRDGEVAGTLRTDDEDREQLAHRLVALMVGREISTVYPQRTSPPGDTVLELRHVSNRARALHDVALRDVSLTVRSGEILFGLTPIDGGEILLRGKSIHVTSPEQAIERGIAYVPEDWKSFARRADRPSRGSRPGAALHWPVAHQDRRCRS